MVSCPCAWPAGEVGSNTPSPRSRRQSSAATYGSWANARRRSLFAAELQVGKERVSRRDRDDPAVVDCDPLEDETEDIVSLRGVPLPIPERTEVGKRGRRPRRRRGLAARVSRVRPSTRACGLRTAPARRPRRAVLDVSAFRRRTTARRTRPTA